MILIKRTGEKDGGRFLVLINRTHLRPLSCLQIAHTASNFLYNKKLCKLKYYLQSLILYIQLYLPHGISMLCTDRQWYLWKSPDLFLICLLLNLKYYGCLSEYKCFHCCFSASPRTEHNQSYQSPIICYGIVELLTIVEKQTILDVIQ